MQCTQEAAGPGAREAAWQGHLHCGQQLVPAITLVQELVEHLQQARTAWSGSAQHGLRCAQERQARRSGTVPRLQLGLIVCGHACSPSFGNVAGADVVQNG